MSFFVVISVQFLVGVCVVFGWVPSCLFWWVIYLVLGGRPYGKYATVETEELRMPLQMGWKREITVREYSKSGIRGDVLYYAPCGKKFKQYPDIMRVRTSLLQFLIHFSWAVSVAVSGKERHQESPEGALQFQHQSLHWRLSQADRNKQRKRRGKICKAYRKRNVWRHWQIKKRKWLETKASRKQILKKREKFSSRSFK